MNKATQLVFGIIMVALLAFMAFKDFPVNLGGGYTGNFDTYSTGFTVATSTVNTTSTQAIASTTILTTLVNYTVSTFTCKPDDKGTTAASSTVAAGAGYVIGAHQASTTSSGFPSYASFGECQAGMSNCYPFKGTLNCVADVAATITKIVH